MHKIKYCLFSLSLFFIIGIIFVIPINTIAEELTGSTVTTRPTTNYSTYQNYDYIITEYDIRIDVNENNTLDITENIHTYFNEPRHGLYRTIPLTNTVRRLDGTTTRNRTQVSNLKVSDTYTTSRQSGNYRIQTGDPDKTIIGDKDYVISYTYNLGKDRIKEYDELYYNIIGTDWETVIDNITFTITMPKDFDKDKLGFSAGNEGSTDYSNVDYEIEGNTIRGRYIGTLGPKEALTVRLELEEGYFVNAGIESNIFSYMIAVLLPIIFTALAAFLWYKYGRDDPVIETVEFNPPEGMNSLEVGFIYSGKATNSDVISLLIYLANKGYIKITETEEKSIFSTKSSFKITKVKDYDGKDKNERLFLTGLFQKKTRLQDVLNEEQDNKNEETTEVTPDDLYDNFYRTINKILQNVNTKERINKILEKNASNKKWMIVVMVIISFCLITIPPMYTYGNEAETILAGLLFPGIGVAVMFSVLFGSTIQHKSTRIVSTIFILIWGIMFAGIPWATMVLPSLLIEPIYLIVYIIGIICIAAMMFFSRILTKRTPYGNEMLGKIKGFKTFLETAEKNKLEALVHENPTYFYDILPYAYVLDVSDTWMSKFESIALEAPDWYAGSTAFNVVTFHTFMNSTMTSATQSMSSSPSSGGSGGGSAGGGSGGGGGGSW